MRVRVRVCVCVCVCVCVYTDTPRPSVLHTCPVEPTKYLPSVGVRVGVAGEGKLCGGKGRLEGKACPWLGAGTP